MFKQVSINNVLEFTREKQIYEKMHKYFIDRNFPMNQTTHVPFPMFVWWSVCQNFLQQGLQHAYLQLRNGVISVAVGARVVVLGGLLLGLGGQGFSQLRHFAFLLRRKSWSENVSTCSARNIPVIRGEGDSNRPLKNAIYRTVGTLTRGGEAKLPT